MPPEKPTSRAAALVSARAAGRRIGPIGQIRRIGLILSIRAAALALALGAGFAAHARAAAPGETQSLDGAWQTGIDRKYESAATVPGLAQDPKQMSPGTLWYRRDITLPAGNWTRASLTLNGARFAPAVYVDGEKVASAEGGMAPIELPLTSPAVAPGRTIRLEIALQSLRDLAPGDASAVPTADRWRSDNSSGLWDSVSLRVFGDNAIARVVPWTEFAGDRVAVHWQLERAPARDDGTTVEAAIVDSAGVVVAHSPRAPALATVGVAEIPLEHHCQPWTPDHPVVYRLSTTLRRGDVIVDRRESAWGLRDFRTEGLEFRLNQEPIRLRAGTIVWHRWLRDPEARTLAFDAHWFEENVLLRLKHLGANTIRFHLGLPPEAFLDQCDRDGMMVQLEWPFFHGIKASPASMQRQWRTWLDVAMRHPSVMLIHAWNETEGDELKAAWSAMNAILPEYPPLVVAHRDVIHIHKYWWSLFENLGLYYDSAAQFDRPIMVDEFGGNYLDGQGNPGAYPTVRESLLRFLGREHTRERRLAFQAEANARVAEYWRRIGAAGFSPFCILSSPEDGNTWFLGPLKDANPKPVWAALAAAYAERSVSVDLWDRNFLAGQHATVPLQFFNDSGEPAELRAEFRVVSDDAARRTAVVQPVVASIPAHGTLRREVSFEMPPEIGAWRVEAELKQPAATSATPVISSWQVRTLAPSVPPVLKGRSTAIGAREPELRALAAQNGLQVVDLGNPSASVIAGSTATWAEVVRSVETRRQLAAAIERGASVVLLDIGPRDLGQGYKAGDLGPLDGAPRVTDPRIERDELFSGIRLTFTEVAEPESHLHPGEQDASLWAGLPREATWLWNGLRGGLVVPATDMEVSGLSADAFVALWRSRGADEARLRGDQPYFALQLAGFYAFAGSANDKAVAAKLRDKVKFLAEDAPALQDRINPNAPIATIDLRAAYRSAAAGQASGLTALASAGKNLDRLPVVELSFGAGRGRVLLSQALTAGRLQRGHVEPGAYGIRYDPAAEQFVLNVLARAVARAGATTATTASNHEN